MKQNSNVLVAIVALLVAGCVDKDAVLFVTDSSIGINVDTKPPTASFSYDRTELYTAPRYPNGAIPPVAASMHTGGANLFNPQIRQFYATGAAAVLATTGAAPVVPTPTALIRDGKTLERMYVGTSTTVGFKIGFSAEGPPDSFVLGYKRKEISVIPLSSRSDPGKPSVDVYPSVLAAIDTVTTTGSGVRDAGFSSSQFFATGQAAEFLAADDGLRSIFKLRAREGLKATLTAAQLAGVQLGTDQEAKIAHILAFITTKDGVIKPDALARLAEEADKKEPPGRVPPSLQNSLKGMKPPAIKTFLSDKFDVVDALVDAIPG